MKKMIIISVAVIAVVALIVANLMKKEKGINVDILNVKDATIKGAAIAGLS